MNSFQKRKKATLSKIDKSSKKSWDEKVVSLCKKINLLENFYTTSSCSGRIVLIIDNTKKSPGLFIKVWHEKINFEQLKKNLNEINKNGTVKFKQEPCILHVACRNLCDAQKLLDKAKLAGWKKSGIIASKNRFVVELNSTEKLEFPIIKNSKTLVDNEFLKIIVKKSNENLKKSWKKIEKLKNIL